jgi:pimeloyl-ACP methyl ester carboxylesterase
MEKAQIASKPTLKFEPRPAAYCNMPTLDVVDATLHYREIGSGSPLLLIHGAGAHADLSDGALPVLAEQHRVIVYDRRGHSRSGSKPAAIQGYLKRQADDAAQLLQGIGATPATVVGWSNGGIIALYLALDYPKLVTRLIVCEPPLHAAKQPPPLSLLGPVLKTMLLSAIGCKRAAVATFFRMLLAQGDGSNAFDDLDEATREGVLVNAATLLHELKTGTGEELTPQRLRALQCPISAIVGGDTLSVFSDATQRLLALLPEMRIGHIPGAGHISVLTHPTDFARLVLQR